ncbi:MAG TPA: O-methyltransferase [Phaeodactylibacter sp.]|nr:O-methyltransferase [Phaeodactylibacter sp.]
MDALNIFKKLNNYCQAHSDASDEILYQLERETQLKTLAPQMMCSPLQGQLLYFLSSMMQADYLLEVGTFTGYASICMARGLADGGILHTIEVNRELEPFIRKYIRLASMEDSIHLHIGDAKEVIPTLDATFDMVFIDAGKQDNDFYYELLLDRVRPGGLLLIDNVLWSGKVLDPSYADEDSLAIDAFNKKMKGDERVETLMLPIRDGLTILRKK